MAITAGATLGNLRVRRATSLSSEQEVAVHARCFRIRIRALTQALQLRLATADSTNFYTIPAATDLTIETQELKGRSLFIIEAAASAVGEILEELTEV